MKFYTLYNEFIEASNFIPKNFTGIVEYYDGTKIWFKNGILHREDGPVKEYADGSKEYWFDDKRHRLDGPAIEHSNSINEYWIHGKKYNEKQYNKVTPLLHSIMKLKGLL